MVKKRWAINMRFVVEAEQAYLANEELLKRLPETDDVLIEYYPTSSIKKFKEVDNPTLLSSISDLNEKLERLVTVLEKLEELKHVELEERLGVL